MLLFSVPFLVPVSEPIFIFQPDFISSELGVFKQGISLATDDISLGPKSVQGAGGVLLIESGVLWVLKSASLTLVNLLLERGC